MTYLYIIPNNRNTMQAIAVIFATIFPIYNCYIITDNFTTINCTDLVVITFNKVVLPWIHPVIITFDNTIVSMNSITISFNSIIVSENIITISMNDIFISRNIIILTFIYIFSLYRQKTNPCRQGQHSHQGCRTAANAFTPLAISMCQLGHDDVLMFYFTPYNFVYPVHTIPLLLTELRFTFTCNVFLFRCKENHFSRQA